jgi:fido (protein-threonine AMPylation protein)
VQNALARTSPEQQENTNVKPVAEIEGAIRDFVRRDHLKASSAKDSVDLAGNVQSLVERANSLGELQNVIEELEQLHDFLHGEGKRLEEEISEYAQLSKSTVNATRLIADNMLRWKKMEAKKS